MDFKEQLSAARRKLKRIASKAVQFTIRPYDSGPSPSTHSARISVVVPVFNAMPYLCELADSLATQDLDPALFEVIAVDDGSSDGSGKFLDTFAAGQPNWRVIRQHNSAWPGKPRNVGINAGVSDYIFFCDADDIMAPEALRRMLEFADKHSVDVLAPRMVGLGGRQVNARLFTETLVDAPLRHILGTLSPQKLIRRSLLEENSIRFPEGRIRLEDGMLMARCYLASSRNSVLADYDFYHLRARDDGFNISAQGTVPKDYTKSVDTIARIIKEHHPDQSEADLLVLDLYRRKILRTYVPQRFASMSRRKRTAWITAHADFINDHVTPALEDHLGFPHVQRSRLARAQDMDGMLRLHSTEKALTSACSLVTPDPSGNELWFHVDSTAAFDTIHLLAFTRDKTQHLSFELRQKTNRHGLSLSNGDLEQLGSSIIDFYIQLRLDGIDGPHRRIQVPSGATPLQHPTLPIYPTVKGNLSLDQRSA